MTIAALSQIIRGWIFGEGSASRMIYGQLWGIMSIEISDLGSVSERTGDGYSNLHDEFGVERPSACRKMRSAGADEVWSVVKPA
jgi:hypothetical protein